MNVFDISALVLAVVVSNEILSLAVLLYFAVKFGFKFFIAAASSGR